MGDHEELERQMRRRSRTVSWDHSVRSDGGDGTMFFRNTTDRGPQLQSPQVPTSPSLRDSSIIEFFDDNMSISRGQSVEKVRFSASRTHSDENDEDYSASVNAILHKRLSVRKGKHQKQRRSSSPVSSMMPDDVSLISDRRRSSAFTTSSGDTAINIENDSISQEQILENIRLHKEVLGSVRQQPWSIRRKMKLVQQAKEYVKKHEGELQERLAMSKSTRDILARFHILVVKQWQHSKREMANFISQIIPWELTIKEIESQFGTVVASYFTFLRWLFWVNFVISVLLAAFIVIPEILTTNKADTGERKTLLPEEEATSMELMTLLNFEGVLQHSPMFYGYYSNRPSSDTGYRLPTAYFITGLVVYIYSFVATLRKMAANSRLSKLSEKDDECIFTWKLFTGWDYMIGNEETAHNRISSIILGFKEALLEEAERMKDKQNWKVITLRIFANLNMIWMLGSSVYAVIYVVARSTEPEAESTLWRKYEITVIMTLIGTFFPIAFEGLGVLESYHPRTTLRVQLARIMALNLLNLYTLTFALFVKINDMTKELLELKPNISEAITSTVLPNITTTLLLMTTVKLNSTMTTTTTPATFLPLNDTIDTYPFCSRRMIKCPFLEPSFSSNFVPATFVPTTNVPQTTAIPMKQARTTLLVTTNEYTTETSSIEDYVHNVGFDNVSNSHDSSTFNPLDDNNWTWAEDNASITDEVFKSVDDLHIIGNYSISSEVTVVEPNVSSMNYDLITNNISTDPAMDSTTDSVTTTEPTASSIVRSTLSSVTESLGSLETEMTSDTVIESIFTTKNECDNCTITQDHRTDNVSSPNMRKKRMSEIIYDGTHCFQVVCSPRPPLSNVTEVPMGFQGFNEKSSETYATTTEHEDAPREDLSLHATCLGLQTRRRLRKLCWETMFGQELVKLTVMDLVSTIISTIFVDFARAVFVRYMNRCWCWNLEKRFPQYGDFKIAENILHLVNNQGMVWMGMFFSPGLPIINVVKLMIMMYVRSWAVLTCNVPHDVVFRASRSNNFYLGLLLTMLFLCVLPVGYAIVWIEPSWHCGPFSQYKKIYHIFTNSIKKAVPNPMVHRVLDYIASPGIIIPLLLLLILIIYYLASLTSSLREANNDLKIQLRRERTEERRKMFELVNRNKRGIDDDDNDYTCMDTTLAKWRQIMPNNKPSTGGPNCMLGLSQKTPTENDVLDRVREKLVHIETDDQQSEKTYCSREIINQPNIHHRHNRHNQQQHLQRHNTHRRSSRSEDSRQIPALSKWKKSKEFVSRLPSTESDSSDQSETIPEIRVLNSSGPASGGSKETSAMTAVTTVDNVKLHSPLASLCVPGNASNAQTPASIAANGLGSVGSSHKAAGTGEPMGVGSGGNGVDDSLDNGSSVEQPVKQRARLKLAQILYKEARRRRQKYVEELQNQQE